MTQEARSATSRPDSLDRATDQGSPSPRAIAGTALFVLAVFAYRALADWNPGRSLADDAPDLFEPSNTSPLFTFGVSCLFLYMRYPRLLRAFRRPAPSAWGFALLVPAAVLFGWAIYTGARDLLFLSLIPAVLGAAMAVVSRELARVLLLPVAFLIFAYPVPAVIANQQVYAFQLGTASLTAWVLDALGFGAQLAGEMIYTGGRVFEVIETCSGLRITETLVSSAFIYGELMGSRRLHTAILVLLAPLLGFLLNTVRVLMIIFNPLAEPSSDHTFQGLAVIVAGVLSFAVIERVLKWVLPGKPRPRAKRQIASSSDRGRLPVGTWAALGLVGAMAAISVWMPRWTPQPASRWSISLPTSFEGYQAKLLEPDRNFLGSVYFSRRIHRRYEKEGVYVETLMAKDDRLKRDRSLLSPKTELPGAGWSIASREKRRFDWAPVEVDEIVAESRGKRVLLYHWREGSRGLRAEAARALLALDASPLREPGELRVFRVSTPLSSHPRGLVRARRRLDLFASAVRDGVEATWPGADAGS